MTSICCSADCSIVSRRIIKPEFGLADIEDVEYRCLNCSHTFHVWMPKLENKLEVKDGNVSENWR